MGTCLSRLKSPACPADIYSTYRQRTPGVRLATGDQCARFNSASDNVLLLITRLCAGAEVNSKNALIGERRRDGERERKCGEFTAPVSFSPWQRWGSVNCSVWQLPLWRRGDWLDAAWPGSASLIKGLKLISLRFHMVGCLWFLSNPSFLFLLHFTVSLFLSFFNISWCACKWGGGGVDHCPWVYIPDSLCLTITSFHLLFFSPSVASNLFFLLHLVPILSHLTFLRSALIQFAVHVCILMSSEQRRHRENEAGSSLYTRFPLYQPHYSSSGP